MKPKDDESSEYMKMLLKVISKAIILYINGSISVDIRDFKHIIGMYFKKTKKEIRQILKEMEALGYVKFNNRRVYIELKGDDLLFGLQRYHQ